MKRKIDLTANMSNIDDDIEDRIDHEKNSDRLQLNKQIIDRRKSNKRKRKDDLPELNRFRFVGTGSTGFSFGIQPRTKQTKELF